MKDVAAERRSQRIRRHARIRKDLAGTAERPRLAVRRSLKHMYAQLIDDVSAVTIVAASTNDKEARTRLADAKSRIDRSRELGKLIAERAKAKGVEQVAFDRGGYLYHGHIKALAEGAREGGLRF